MNGSGGFEPMPGGGPPEGGPEGLPPGLGDASQPPQVGDSQIPPGESISLFLSCILNLKKTVNGLQVNLFFLSQFIMNVTFMPCTVKGKPLEKVCLG